MASVFSGFSRFQVPLLSVGAFALRLGSLRRPAGGMSTGEELLLGTVSSVTGGLPVPADPGQSSAWVTALSILHRFTGEPTITLANAPSLPPDPDPLLGAARILAALLCVVAVALTAVAARRLGGLAAAWVAGGLVALSPLALSQGATAGPGALNLAVAAGLLCAVAGIRPRASFATRWAPALWGGAAVAAGGGGAGLLAGLLVVGTPLPAWIAGGLAGALLAPGAVAAFPMLPRGSFAFPAAPPPSPFLAGILVLASAVGWPGLAVAVPGKLLALARRDDSRRAAHAVVYATGGAFVVALLRPGSTPADLCSALPGVALLAGIALASLRPIGALPWTPGVVRAVVLLVPAIGAWATVSSPWRGDALEETSEWIRFNAPSAATILSEEPRLDVPTKKGLAQLEALVADGRVGKERLEEYSLDGRVFGVLPLPPRTRRPLERALFYDPNLASHFSYLVLRDLPKTDDATSGKPEELRSARRLFHEYFRDRWHEAARFKASRRGEAGLTVLRRPDGFEVDLKSLGELGVLLVSEPLEKLRRESARLTDWAMEAGLASLEEGNVDGARAYLGMVTERDPDRVDARYEFAKVLMLRGQMDRAKEELLAGMSLDPYDGRIHLQLGMVLEREGDVAGAITEYRAAVDHLDDPSVARARLGAILYRTGDTSGAREQLSELRASAPRSEATRTLEAVLSPP